MPIALTLRQIAEIRDHGCATYPEECCGFLLGEHGETVKTVHALRRARNMREATARGRRYLVDPREFLAAEAEARAKRWELIGIYHSHPNEAAVPSPYDREHAWPWYSYLILSVYDRRPETLRSWVLREDRSSFDEEPLTLRTQGDPLCP